MQVRLEVAHSKANVKRVVLRHDAVIGRSAECSLRIASSLVSRQHCALTLKDGVVYVRDLQSSNGTYLNGTPLKAYEDVVIPPGSELSVGGVRFYVRYDSTQPIAGPGSTVDLPGREQPTDSGTTAEWKVKDVVTSAGAGAVAAADAAVAVPPAEPAETEAEPVDLEEAEPAVAETEPPFQMPTAPVMPMRVAMPFEVPADPMATPSVVPANVPAAAPDEEVVAAKGDEIDTVMVESEGPSETETIEASAFRFEEPAESFAAATEETQEAESEAGDRKEKKGLRSLFSLFGRKKMPHLEETASADLAGEPVLPFASAAPAPDDTVSEDATEEALPADLAAAADSEAPAALPVSVDDTIPVELLETSEDAEPIGAEPASSADDSTHAAASAEEDPEEAGFNDFLKQIGQK